MSAPLVLSPLLGLPEVVAGDDLAALLAPRLADADEPVVLVVSSKVVSKALGLTAPASSRAAVVDAETVRVVAERRAGEGVTRVVESAAGPVMAAAGVDASNVGSGEVVLTLPRDADREAAQLRRRLLHLLGRPDSAPLGIVVSDTAGRPWRAGLTDFALGSAGVLTQLDHRGEADADGRPMVVSVRCLVDELAAAADLVKGKNTSVPAALVTGLAPACFAADAPGARSLVRTGPWDWFALGHVEAARAALGVEPGSARSREIGIRSVNREPLEARVRRALALAGADGADIGPKEAGGDTASASIAVTDPYAAGRLVARLEVALWSEDLAGAVTWTACGLTVRAWES